MKINQFLKINAVAIAAVMFTGALMSFKIVEKRQLTNSSITIALVLQQVHSLMYPTGQKEQVHLVLQQETNLVQLQFRKGKT